MTATITHALIVEDLVKWGFGRKFQAKCSCRRWESSIEDNRPDVTRQHTVHVMDVSEVFV